MRRGGVAEAALVSTPLNEVSFGQVWFTVGVVGLSEGEVRTCKCCCGSWRTITGITWNKGVPKIREIKQLQHIIMR